MEVASLVRPRHSNAPLVGGHDLANELRAAVLNGDEARIALLLAELVRLKRPTDEERMALQLHTLRTLVQALRSLAICDETTGLTNRRGFVQSATRLLDLAVRDRQEADLIYFHLGEVQPGSEVLGPVTSQALLREMGNLMRDLFPRYGVYEVLGRLSSSEFAALTLSAAYASRQAILGRASTAKSHCDLPALRLSVGIAHFDPQRPVGIDELLERARQAMHAEQRVVRFASSGPTPPTRSDALPTVSRRRRYGVAEV
jgi:GGDEF domain-containing protein